MSTPPPPDPLVIFQKHINNYLYELEKQGAADYAMRVQSECQFAMEQIKNKEPPK
jgi:hypothetical protein